MTSWEYARCAETNAALFDLSQMLFCGNLSEKSVDLSSSGPISSLESKRILCYTTQSEHKIWGLFPKTPRNVNCPICHSETKVVDSRPVYNDTVIRRRRECLSCKARFSTHEEMELLDLQVEKKDGILEPYNREKVEMGVRKALEKRPFDNEAVLQLIREIEVRILSEAEESIPSRKIGQIVMRKLRQLDEVAYIRFASVYKDFASVEDFQSKIEQMNVQHKTRKTKIKARA